MVDKLRLPDGTLIDVEPAARLAPRWAVGAMGGRRSSTWRFWANKKGDFYLSARNLGGVLKMSLHRDGRCHFGLTAPCHAARGSHGDRHWDRWTLPIEPWTKVVQVIVPESQLRRFTPKPDRQLRWIPAPQPSGAVVIGVFLVKPEIRVNRWPGFHQGAKPVGVATAGGRIAWIVAKTEAIDYSMQEQLDEARAVLSSTAPVPKRRGLRAIVLFGQGGGPRTPIELAWQD